MICTHNRPADLTACLAALTRQWRTGTEIVVVDSASEPQTGDALAQFLAKHPQIVLRRLNWPGLSMARNAAVSFSKGRWLAILDDDTVPDPGWLNEIFALIERLPAKAGAAGLYTYPLWPEGREIDLPVLWRKYLSLVEIEVEEDCTSTPVFVGANMLLRRDALIEAGGFPERLARQNQLLLSGDDVYVAEKMRREGWAIWYSSRPRVGHRVHLERLDPAWLRKRLFWEGVTAMRLHAELDGVMPLFPVARAFAFAPVLFGLSCFDPPRGTLRARAMWHFGVLRAYFARQPLLAQSSGAANGHGGLGSRPVASPQGVNTELHARGTAQQDSVRE